MQQKEATLKKFQIFRKLFQWQEDLRCLCLWMKKGLFCGLSKAFGIGNQSQPTKNEKLSRIVSVSGGHSLHCFLTKKEMFLL